MQLAARSFLNRAVHRVDELTRAIGIGVARPVVVVRAVVDRAAPERERHRSRRRKEEPVAEGDVGAHRLAIAFGELVGITFLGDILRGMREQAAIAVGEDGPQIKEALLHAVMRGDRLRALDFLVMALTIGNGKRVHILGAVARNRHGEQRGRIHAARAQNERLLFDSCHEVTLPSRHPAR